MLTGQQRAFWGIVIALLLLTRLPAAAEYFSIDNVNLALALETFDPMNHQPQPPGYPFFVGFARLVHMFGQDVHTTFLVIALFVTAACLLLTAAVGKRMFNTRTGYAAVLLLLLNPVFWQTGLDGPLRPFLALFSLWSGYCAWRAWNGEPRFVLWGALSLGLGSGFRPDLLAYLGALWLVSALVGVRSIKVVAQGAVILVAVMLVWIGSLAYAVGGIGDLYILVSDYLVDQSSVESVLLGASEQGAMRQLSRLVTWNALAVIGWVWAAPFALLSRDRWRKSLSQLTFIAVWLVPGLVFQALVHVAAPGHTLFSIPPLCLLGGWMIWSAGETLSPEDPSRVAEPAIAGALVLSVLLFLNFFPLPSTPAVPSFFQSLKNAAGFATYETSIGLVRSMDDVAQITMRELDDLTKSLPVTTPWVIVTTDVHDRDWFMNWRILRYYAPQAKIIVASHQSQPRHALLVRRNQTIASWTGDTVNVELPQGGRVIWLLEPNAPFQKALEQVQRVERRRQLVYTDLPANAAPFEVFNFRFVPKPMDAAAIRSSN